MSRVCSEIEPRFHFCSSYGVGDSILTAIEVKHSDRVRPRDLTSLKSFQSDYPGSSTILLYRGKDRYLRDNILVLPCTDFLMNMDEFLK